MFYMENRIRNDSAGQLVGHRFAQNAASLESWGDNLISCHLSTLPNGVRPDVYQHYSPKSNTI